MGEGIIPGLLAGDAGESVTVLFMQFSGLPHISELHNKSIKKALPQ